MPSMKLTRTERDVLRFFERNRGKSLTRTDIVAAVWEEEYFGLTNIVDVNVHSLRSKLGPEIIKTVRGVGYVMPAAESNRPAQLSQ